MLHNNITEMSIYLIFHLCREKVLLQQKIDENSKYIKGHRTKDLFPEGSCLTSINLAKFCKPPDIHKTRKYNTTQSHEQHSTASKNTCHQKTVLFSSSSIQLSRNTISRSKENIYIYIYICCHSLVLK